MRTSQRRPRPFFPDPLRFRSRRSPSQACVETFSPQSGFPFLGPRASRRSEAEALHITVQARVKLLSRGAQTAQPQSGGRRREPRSVSPQARFFPPLWLPLRVGFWPAFPLLGRFPPQRVKFRTWFSPRQRSLCPGRGWRPQGQRVRGNSRQPCETSKSRGLAVCDLLVCSWLPQVLRSLGTRPSAPFAGARKAALWPGSA